MSYAVLQGDCLEMLKELPDNSVDSLVTDPPAGISFMGKSWDSDKGGRDEWIKWMRDVMRECLRVLKPGAHGLVWALPRTSHWTAMALEDAGFEIRDSIYHLFGQGFPKSLDVSKAIDKAAGAEREKLGVAGKSGSVRGSVAGDFKGGEYFATAPAATWQGWGTALKPAVECWWLIRKPCSEKTVAANVLRWGTGAINIDGSRIEGEANRPTGLKKDGSRSQKVGNDGWDRPWKHDERANRVVGDGLPETSLGRFPSHLILDEHAGEMLDGQSGHLHGAGSARKAKREAEATGLFTVPGDGHRFGDSGGASRFFYCAKISASERGKDNKHPTVKPQKLMRYLCKLITPPGGLVLDPFTGSGSTGVAALTDGFAFIGIEREAEYCAIAEKRMEAAINKKDVA